MHSIVKLNKYKETENGTELIITVPNLSLAEMIEKKHIATGEIRLDDGRHISSDQRKKAYATIRDISDYTGYTAEDQKEWLKYLHIQETGCEPFSLADCTMDRAREFINTIMFYALENGIPLSDFGIDRTDDIDRYLWCCLKARRCAVCGRDGEIHHVDAIGAGNDRKRVDDSTYRKICLCRTHHTMAHQLGNDRFTDRYKVYGIIFKEDKK